MRNWMWTANLSNSIVGVSVLAMPFCIQQCGLILGLLLLLFSATVTKLSCGLLIRAAQISRRSSYEALALSTFGSLGKNIVEVSIIGLQLGTCIAFYVIIGDLAPPTIARMTGLSWSPATLRTVILCASAVVIVLPLAMLRDIANLSSISIASLSFYVCFLLYLLCLAIPNVFSGKLWSHVTWWNVNGIFKCVPIFSLAFACHTQLLIIYDAHPDPTLSRMSGITSNAVNLTGSLYGLVAIGGYLTFCIDHVEGDILSNFYPSLISQLIKLCFALSVVVSFPMMIFPCRLSIHSLISQIQIAPLDSPVRIPQSKFIPITIFITFLTLVVAILLPHIETVLALTGATAGSLISFVYPAAIFLSVTRSKDEHCNTAKVIMGIGLIILMTSTVSILISSMDDTSDVPKAIDYHWPQPKLPDDFPVWKDHEDILPNDADKLVQHEGGVEDKGGGGGGDTRVEQYPDKVVKGEATEAKQSSPISPSVKASDDTQTTATKDEHKELISKLEVLEERVEKLESENQELKKESEKLVAQATDTKQGGDEKVTENVVKAEGDGKAMKDEALKSSSKVVAPTKSDDSLIQVDDSKDNKVDTVVHQKPVDLQQQQQLIQHDTKADANELDLNPVKKEYKEDGAIDNKNFKDVQQKEETKSDDQIPDLHPKDIDHNLAFQGADSKKVYLEHKVHKITQEDQDDVIALEKNAVKSNADADLFKAHNDQHSDHKVPDIPHLDQNSEHKVPDIPHIDQNPEHKIPDIQNKPDAGRTKRSTDENLEDLEQKLPKLDTGVDVGILSRDLLNNNKQRDDAELATEAPQVESNKVDLTKTTAPAARQNGNTTKSEKTNVLKRDILSLKLTKVNNTRSLNNG